PIVLTRVKERCELAGVRVDARKIWTFECVAPCAGQGEVIGLVASAMLLGDDVFDVVSELDLFLAEETILATVAGTRSDVGLDLRIHRQAPFVDARRCFDFNLRIAMMSPIST